VYFEHLLTSIVYFTVLISPMTHNVNLEIFTW